METFIDYCKSYIADHLGDYEGQNVYLYDLGFTITEGPNCDGTLTYSTAEAMEYLKEWMWDAADYYDYARDNFGEVQNPFANPEAYMVCMVIEGVRTMIDRAISELGLDDQWNDEVELTEDLIRQIVDCVGDMEFKDDKVF